MLNQIFAACLMMAAQNYAIPPQVLIGILHVEGGKVGQQVRNTNGTYDLGPMQINTLWTKELSRIWGVPRSTAHRLIRDDACTNVNVAAWIFRRNLNETKSLPKAIEWYNSRTPHIGRAYKRKVLAAMRDNNLLQQPKPQRDGTTKLFAFMGKAE
jgi:hypothetical protein